MLKLGLLLVFFAFTVFPQSDGDVLEKRVTLRTKEIPLRTAIVLLMANYDVRFGFEESVADRSDLLRMFSVDPPLGAPLMMDIVDGVYQIASVDRHMVAASSHPIKIDAVNKKLRDVLDEIIGQVPAYSWTNDSGVINFIPTKDRDPRFRDLLRLQIESFAIPPGRTVGDLPRDIGSIPEFQKFLADHRLEFAPIRNGPTYILAKQRGRVLDSGLDLHRTTFVEILNSICKVKGGAWVINWEGERPDGTGRINIVL
jgi:hypothetical protein